MEFPDLECVPTKAPKPPARLSDLLKGLDADLAAGAS
jgi:hypothetical protein